MIVDVPPGFGIDDDLVRPRKREAFDGFVDDLGRTDVKLEVGSVAVAHDLLPSRDAIRTRGRGVTAPPAETRIGERGGLGASSGTPAPAHPSRAHRSPANRQHGTWA